MPLPVECIRDQMPQERCPSTSIPERLHSDTEIHTHICRDLLSNQHFFLCFFTLSQLSTSISANADGPRDAVSRKIDHIALPTEYNYQAMSISQQQIATPIKKCRLWTHLNNNAQSHLVNLLFIYYTPKFATYTVTNQIYQA